MFMNSYSFFKKNIIELFLIPQKQLMLFDFFLIQNQNKIMIIILLILLLSKATSLQGQTFKGIQPTKYKTLNQYYVYEFQQQKVHYLTHISSSIFSEKLRNLQIQTIINILKKQIHEGTTFISASETLGIQQIIIAKNMKEKGNVKIVKEDIFEYTMLRKNIYLNDLEEYTSIYNMKIANFTCLNSEDNVFYQSLRDWISLTIFSATQYLFLLSFEEYCQNFETLENKILKNDIKLKILIQGRARDYEAQFWNSLVVLRDKNYKIFKVFPSRNEKNQILITYQEVSEKGKEDQSFLKDSNLYMVNYSI